MKEMALLCLYAVPVFLGDHKTWSLVSLIPECDCEVIKGGSLQMSSKEAERLSHLPRSCFEMVREAGEEAGFLPLGPQPDQGASLPSVIGNTTESSCLPTTSTERRALDLESC